MGRIVDVIAPVGSQTNLVTTVTGYQVFACASDGTDHVIFEDIDEAAVRRELAPEAGVKSCGEAPALQRLR